MVSVVSRRLEKQPGRFVDGTGTLQLAARVAVPSTERPTEIGVGHWPARFNAAHAVDRY